MRIITDIDSGENIKNIENLVKSNQNLSDEFWSCSNQENSALPKILDNSPACINQITKHREAISNLINSRSSNRLNAANEILFGQSNPFSYKSDRDVPQVFNQNSNQVVFKDRNSLNFNGYESYIDKQERLLKENSISKRIVNINTNRLKAFRSNAINKNSHRESMNN